MYDNSIVEFWRTKNRYKVLNMNSKMKHPETGDWIPAVIYQEYKVLDKTGEYIETTNGQVYIREKTDFINKFSLVLDL